jgi:hypothetical protein
MTVFIPLLVIFELMQSTAGITGKLTGYANRKINQGGQAAGAAVKKKYDESSLGKAAQDRKNQAAQTRELRRKSNMAKGGLTGFIARGGVRRGGKAGRRMIGAAEEQLHKDSMLDMSSQFKDKDFDGQINGYSEELEKAMASGNQAKINASSALLSQTVAGREKLAETLKNNQSKFKGGAGGATEIATKNFVANLGLKGNKADVHQWATGTGDIGTFNVKGMSDQEIAGHSAADIEAMTLQPTNSLQPDAARRIMDAADSGSFELTHDKREKLQGVASPSAKEISEAREVQREAQRKARTNASRKRQAGWDRDIPQMANQDLVQDHENLRDHVINRDSVTDEEHELYRRLHEERKRRGI